MKFLTLIVLASALNVFACPGGRAVLSGGKIVLYPSQVVEVNNEEETETSVHDMLENEQTISATQIVPGGESRITTNVSVVDIKEDRGGIISTVYEVKVNSTYMSQKNSSVEYYQVNSNYIGNGVSAKGMPAKPKYEITKSFGCHNRE